MKVEDVYLHLDTHQEGQKPNKSDKTKSLLSRSVTKGCSDG